MRFLLIVNPVSGRGRGERIADRLRERLSRYGDPLTVRKTEKPGDARTFASQARAGDRIVCVGGDGTLHEIVNGIDLSSPPVLMLFPAGTGNVMSAELRLPGTVGRAVRLARSDRIRWLDAGRFGEKRFLLMAGIGFDANVVETFHRQRGGTTHIAQYASVGLRTMFNWTHTPVDVHIDGRKRTEGASFVQIANVRRYGGPLLLSPDARFDDGRFTVSWLEGTGRTGLLRLFLSATMGLPDHNHDYRSASGQTVRVVPAGDRTPYLQLDGDPVPFSREPFRILPRSVPFLTPLASRRSFSSKRKGPYENGR